MREGGVGLWGEVGAFGSGSPEGWGPEGVCPTLVLSRGCGLRKGLNRKRKSVVGGVRIEEGLEICRVIRWWCSQE